jgi:hypothetical protein
MASIIARLRNGRLPNISLITLLWPMIAEICLAIPANWESMAMWPLTGIITGHHSINNRFSLFRWWHPSSEGNVMVDYQISVDTPFCDRWSRRYEVLVLPASFESIAVWPITDFIAVHHSINYRFSLFLRWHPSLQGKGMEDYQLSVNIPICGRWSRRYSWLYQVIEYPSLCALSLIT